MEHNSKPVLLSQLLTLDSGWMKEWWNGWVSQAVSWAVQRPPCAQSWRKIVTTMTVSSNSVDISVRWPSVSIILLFRSRLRHEYSLVLLAHVSANVCVLLTVPLRISLFCVQEWCSFCTSSLVLIQCEHVRKVGSAADLLILSGYKLSWVARRPQ
jgi:hypothetical protein